MPTGTGIADFKGTWPSWRAECISIVAGIVCARALGFVCARALGIVCARALFTGSEDLFS